MAAFVCATCGVQHADSREPPERCAICEDERQYVGAGGQRWTTLEELRANHRADIREEDEGLLGIGCEPEFGIGQRALLVQTEHGNVLWDCVPLLEGMAEEVARRGGLSAIALDHPHFHSTWVDWAREFDCPVYVHADDARWVMRCDERLVLWEGETRELLPGLTLVRCGGHFEGGAVLHWADGAGGRGALLSADIVTVVADPRWVSFMYSYPNYIPLGPSAIRRIVAALEPWEFDRIHGGWWGRVVREDGKGAVRRSAERYLRAVAT